MRYWVYTSVICLFLVSCSGLGLSSPTNIVRAKYDALSRNDQNAYLDTIVPDTRAQIGTLNVMANAMTAAFINLDPLDMNYGGWMDSVAGMRFEYRDMKYDIIEQTNDYALVKAYGTLQTGVVNFKYCMYQDVRKVGGVWYNDELSDKKQQRTVTLVERQMQRLNTIANSVGVDPLFGSADLAMIMDPRVWDILFDLC